MIIRSTVQVAGNEPLAIMALIGMTIPHGFFGRAVLPESLTLQSFNPGIHPRFMRFF
ncbi:MAG: hypothetical protein ACTHNH_06635 [Mesorhizobium sp.]